MPNVASRGRWDSSPPQRVYVLLSLRSTRDIYTLRYSSELCWLNLGFTRLSPVQMSDDEREDEG